MDSVALLDALDDDKLLADLFTVAPVVAPGSVVSNNLEWSNRFHEGRTAYYRGSFEEASEIFSRLDRDLPGHDRFLTPAKINETFCWLRRGRSLEYIQFYEPLFAQNKVYGVVLWNLVVGYARVRNAKQAEFCLTKWLQAPSIPNLAKAYFLLSVLQHRNGRPTEATKSFEKAWATDRDFCTRAMSRCLGNEVAGRLLGIEITGEFAVRKLQPTIAAKEEVISSLSRLLIPRSPGKSPQIAQQLSEFEYQSGYVAALEKFGDGDIDGALAIIDSLMKGNDERDALSWAKAACLLAKREWKAAILLIEDQMTDPTTPGGVLWNASCAYFNLGRYENALSAIRGCTDREFRTSALAWLTQGLLAHLCGRNDERNDSIGEGIRISPKQLVYHIGVLRQIGIELVEFPGKGALDKRILDDAEAKERYKRAVESARLLLKHGQRLQAAQEFASLAPVSVADIPEIGDTTFKPAVWPTCPAELYDFRDLFLSGMAAYQRKALEEAVERFGDLHRKTDRSRASVVNLTASLILLGAYTRAEDILRDAVGRMKEQDPYILRNLISALARSEKFEEAFPLYDKLLDVSNRDYFNFVQMARVAELLGRKEAVATALFNACTENLAEPSPFLKEAAVRACLEVKDNARAVALVQYFVDEKPLPYVVAGKTRPRMPARDCKTYLHMKHQWEIFSDRNDARAALAYFQEVHLAREADYGISISSGTVGMLVNACLFYAKSLIWKGDLEIGYEVLNQACNLLGDHSQDYTPTNLSTRYRTLAEIYFSRGHYFWALELCERGLEADSNDQPLRVLHQDIERKLMRIPERSREAIKELTELPLATAEPRSFLNQLPKISQLVETLQEGFPQSRAIISRLGDVTAKLLSMEAVPILDRKKDISRLKETTAKIERDMRLDLPRAFMSALLPLFRAIRRTLDDFRSKSVCPELKLTLEPVSFYRESEASLLYNLRNIGSADIHDLRIKIENASQQQWVPVLEEQSFSPLKKDGVLWVDWPIHLDAPPTSDSTIRPNATITFTGGSLRGEFITEVAEDQEAKLQPFFDITVEYPVIALKPQDNSKLFGRENLLRTLKNCFTTAGQTRIPFLQGVRKVGKTSILYFLAARLPKSFLPVYVNLEPAWTNPYQWLSKCVSDETIARGYTAVDHHNVLSRDDFDKFLASVMRLTDTNHIILLLDEFHAVIDRIRSGSLPGEFLGDLRDIYQNRQHKISVAFADWYSIDELKSRVSAQLWADLAREPISFLNELDTREAVQSPAQGSPLRFEQHVISRIYYWTNGYPWHVQWICAELISHLDIQKRYVAIVQDIDLIVQKLLREDRLFDEGLCRPERITRFGQLTVYAILEYLKESRHNPGVGFARESLDKINVPFDLKLEVARLKSLEILQEQDGQLRFCSPLHGLWFAAKCMAGLDVHGERGNQGQGKTVVETAFSLPEDPPSVVRQRCDALRELKSQLRRALGEQRQVFRNLEMPGEWADASTVVQTQNSWAVFVGALRALLVEDLVTRLDDWEDKGRYPDLYRELQSIRERRNYVEHPESIQGRVEEERRCSEDLGKRFPTSTSDWLTLQLKALDRLIDTLGTCIEQAARRK